MSSLHQRLFVLPVRDFALLMRDFALVLRDALDAGRC
jgi:hypothetical protein